MTTFYFIRHGQTTANALGLKQGTINDDRTHLNAVGQAQISHLRDQFDISFADRIFVSPLDRTRETARILNQLAQLPTATDERLLEISYGAWDGQKNDELEATHPAVFDPVIHDVLPDYVQLAHGGETFEHVRDRVASFMVDATADHPNENIIVITHGFTVKAAAIAATQTPNFMSLPEPANASVTKIAVTSPAIGYYMAYYNRFDAQTY